MLQVKVRLHALLLLFQPTTPHERFADRASWKFGTMIVSRNSGSRSYLGGQNRLTAALEDPASARETDPIYKFLHHTMRHGPLTRACC